MKLSKTLYTHAVSLWEEAAAKPFVTQMALGTLDQEHFRYYMLQDYLYLMDYIDILNSTLSYTQDPDLQSFLRNIINETKNELERVHLPNMRKYDIGEDEIRYCAKADVIARYLAYMRRKLEEEGLLAGLTALLQCSWVYAYIARRVTGLYPEAIAASPYRSWFEAYTCQDYLTGNQKWIDILDKETAGIPRQEEDELCDIFKMCAIYENRLWDCLYEMPD